MEDGVKSGQTTDAFLKKVERELNLTKDELEESDAHLGETFEKLVELEKKGINGVWARIIKNAFAPLFVGKFDLIVGNPPWVNWEALPQEYRDATAHIWKKYDLFEHTGLRARLGSAKDDISVLMTYVAIDKYLKDKGKLCFVITQTIFKTVGGGEGFRRFELGKEGIPFSIMQVDDMVALQPFDSATNRTALFLCQKGEKTKYPVEYHLWKKKEKGSIAIDLSWQEVQEKTLVKYLKAQSIDGTKQGPWISARPKALSASKKIVGKSEYQAREGTNTGGANGVLWVEVKNSNNHLCTIENLHDIGKKKIASHNAKVEQMLIFPLLRGRDIKRWVANPSIQILIPHDLNKPSKTIEMATMERDYPYTLEFLNQFYDNLRSRALYKKYLEPQGVPFYGMYNIGPYTFATYKLVWSEVGHDLEAAVVSSFNNEHIGEKVVVPDHTVVAIPFEDYMEAHYVCSLLNSSPAQFLVRGYVVLHPSPHVLKYIRIPQYDNSNSIHQDLAKLSKSCHDKAASGIDVIELEEQIDKLAVELWGLSKDELKDIKDSLEELK
jgi:hypothetical protein